jgi:AcrR family transcriptional regulator
MSGVPTSAALIRAATDLFVQRGYDGTSIRAITQLAGANLGAVTYHFGSKNALYDAVAASLTEPLRQRVSEAGMAPGRPLDRLESLVRAVFQHLQDHPDLPRFMLQQLTGTRPPPQAVRQTLAANHGLIARLITEGQADSSIREGDPRLMALSIVAQPIWMNIVRQLLRQTVGIDQDDPQIRAELVDTAVRFVRAGLTP